MRLRSNLTVAGASRERGFALIAVLALAALMSAYLIATALSAAGFVNEREDRNMNALRQAKAALIAYAASEQWQKYKAEVSNQPGGLPCPDGDNDGSSDGICPSALLRIGRLPYKTIGSADFTDAVGERLWYAVSSNFYKNAANIINSDTPGLLTVTGTAPASNVVAIVFAPGPPTRDPVTGLAQDRSAANIDRLASYLEGFTAGANDYTFTTNELPNDTFNDRLLVITQAELMAAVEPVVAARIERDIKPYIAQSYTNADPNWRGGFPFAVPWGGGAGPGQPQDDYKGNISTSHGLMPLTRDSGPGWVEWDPTSVSIVDNDSLDTGSSDLTSVNCSASTPGELSCLVNYSGSDSDDRPGIRLRAILKNAGRAFVRPALRSDTDMTQFDGTWTDWSTTMEPDVDSLLLGGAQAGDARITFDGRLRPAVFTSRPLRIRVTVPPYHPISDPTDTTSGWFIANRWYRQTYYAVSPGWIPGAGASCAANCLTVNNLPTPNNNKRLILVFAGRALDGSTRPTNNLANYFEGQNFNPTDLIFENRAGAAPAINDRVVVVAP